MTYQRFAHVYDQLMTDIPYADYVAWVTENAPVSNRKKLLDIGCGTGSLSLLFHEAGYDVTGIDLSEEMLSIAKERLEEAGAVIPLFAQSMCELEGFADFDIAVIAIDSLNYLQNPDEVRSTFKKVHDSLKVGAHLFFDVHSIYKVDHLFMDSPFVYDDGEISYIWFTEEGEYPHSVHHDLTFYVGLSNGLYERFEEHQLQRTYPLEDYLSWLTEAGFTKVSTTADWTDALPSEKSERIFLHAIK